jgi:SAM-dependent methyltransferase
VYATDLAYVHDAGFGDVAHGAAPAIARLLRDRGIRRGHIVEVGCGSGIAARHFLARGYAVTGIDASAAMIRLARAKAPGARFRVAMIERARLPPCDAVVAIGEILSYGHGGLPMLRRFFRRVHDALRPGGIFAFDFVDSAAGRTFAAKTSGGADWAVAATATFDPARRVLTRRIIVVRRVGRLVRNATEVHHVHIYSRAQIRGALAAAGFSIRLSRSYGTYRMLRGDAVVVATRRAV